MANKRKISGGQPAGKGTYLHKSNWEVMKPFVRFAFAAMAVVGTAVWAVVKFIPKAVED